MQKYIQTALTTNDGREKERDGGRLGHTPVPPLPYWSLSIGHQYYPKTYLLQIVAEAEAAFKQTLFIMIGSS